jgi:hypothetical protein
VVVAVERLIAQTSELQQVVVDQLSHQLLELLEQQTLAEAVAEVLIQEQRTQQAVMVVQDLLF